MPEPVRIMDAALAAFSREDCLHQGQLSKAQLKSLYKNLKLNLTQPEEDALYSELDQNLDHFIQETELLKFLIRDFSTLSNPLAKKALMKIRTTFSPSPIELYLTLQKMPSSFLPSFTQNLFSKAAN